MALRNEHEELLSAWRSMTSTDTAEGWRAIHIGSGRCRAGVRFPANEEGLLVGFNIAAPGASELPQGRGFSMARVGDAPSGGFDLWLGVVRKPAASLEMFTLMAADLLAAVNTGARSDELRAYHQLLSRVRSWQQFMERPRDRRLSDEEEVGLVGELSLLRRLLDTGTPVAAVMDYWKGPANGLRDFVTEALDIEVKATVSVNGFPARISSLEQLDDVSGRRVCLAAFRFSVQDTGQTLPEMIDAVRNEIGDQGRSAFERSLLLAGYEDAYAAEYRRGFVPVDQRVFVMAEDFPRLSRSGTPLAVRSAEYELDLDLVTAAAIELDDILPAPGGPVPL